MTTYAKLLVKALFVWSIVIAKAVDLAKKGTNHENGRVRKLDKARGSSLFDDTGSQS